MLNRITIDIIITIVLVDCFNNNRENDLSITPEILERSVEECELYAVTPGFIQETKLIVMVSL